MVMLGAEVWTYWLAPPLLATALMLVVLTTVGYYRRVALPSYLAEQQRRLQAISSAREGEQRVPHLPKAAPNDGRALAA